MENLKLIDKLKEKANISYEEAKIALENSNWDILEAFLYLEDKGRVEKPSVSVFYTNEVGYSEKSREIMKIKETKYKTTNSYQGIFEVICRYIDTYNNIFLEIKNKDRLILKVPLTVIILLLLFMFWIIIPLTIVGLFFDIKLYIYSKRVNTDKANKVLSEISKRIKNYKRKI